MSEQLSAEEYQGLVIDEVGDDQAGTLAVMIDVLWRKQNLFLGETIRQHVNLPRWNIRLS